MFKHSVIATAAWMRIVYQDSHLHIYQSSPTGLAEYLNPRLDNDIIPAWLFLKDFGISFHPHHTEFIPYSFIKPWAVRIPRVKETRNGLQQGYKIPFIVVNINDRPMKILLDSTGSGDMLSHRRHKIVDSVTFPRQKFST